MSKFVFVLFEKVAAAPATPTFVKNYSGPAVIHGVVEGTGAVSASLTWYGNTVESTVGAVVIATQNLSGTDIAADGAPISAEWPYIFCIPSAITGTGATVSARGAT